MRRRPSRLRPAALALATSLVVSLRCVADARGATRAALVAVAWLLLAPSPGLADALTGSAPAFCPPGFRPYIDHSGAGCMRELPRDCPAGYEPGAWDDVAYCQPPPAVACPTGSIEGNRGPDRPACDLMPICETDDDCWDGTSCRAAALCLSGGGLLANGNIDPRDGRPEVLGACGAGGTCESGGYCEATRRCDPDVRLAGAVV